MKNYYLIIPTFLTIIFIGCSSTYTIKDFPSKEKFYEDYNKFMKDKKVKVTLTNDNSFTILDGSKISNDSIVYITNTIKKDIIIKQSEIKSLRYYYNNSSIPSAWIFLKDGENINSENVELLPDSSINVLVKSHIYSSLPLSKVKEIEYKNHLLGVPPRLLSGSILGLIAGYFVFSVIHSQNDQATDAISAIPILSALGFLTGSIWGWINGYNYIYQFNP